MSMVRSMLTSKSHWLYCFTYICQSELQHHGVHNLQAMECS